MLNLSSKYTGLVPDVNYDYMIGYGFMKFNKTLNQEELLVLINKMQNEKDLYYVYTSFPCDLQVFSRIRLNHNTRLYILSRIKTIETTNYDKRSNFIATECA